MSGPWRMLRTAPEPNGTEQRALKSGRRKRQKRMPMPESRRQLQKKQRRCGGSPKKGTSASFCLWAETPDRQSCQQGGRYRGARCIVIRRQGCPCGKWKFPPWYDPCEEKSQTGSVKSSAQGTLSQMPSRPRNHGRSPQEQKKQEAGRRSEGR